MRIFMDRFRRNFSDCFSPIVIALTFLCFIVIGDTGTTAALCWLAVVFSVSFFMRPFMPASSLRFANYGFALCFGLGLFICFYPAWTIAALTGCTYGNVLVYTSFIVMASLGFVIRRYVLHKPYAAKEEVKDHINGFAVFAVIFLVFFWVIGFNPVVDSGTENYMDYGFIKAIFRQQCAIPNDIWFSGTKLNYYYLGQAASVYLIRLAHTTPEYGYNLMLCTFIATVFGGVYEIVYGICHKLLADHPQKEVCARWGGITGAGVAAFASNCHWIVYGLFTGSYWIPDPTVFIRTELGDPDNGKNEFPAYSVILGDLHAHVINVIFVLPLLAILLDHCFADKEKKKGRLYSLLLLSFMLGMFKGSNYWDFAIYYVIAGAAIVFTELKQNGLNIRALGIIASKAVTVTLVSIIAIIPFTMNFIKMESGVALCEVHSPLYKLAVLWLVPVIAAVILIVLMYPDSKRDYVSSPVARSGLLAMILCTIGLVITPEVVYVIDIYGKENSRFNTMFKLTYQAFLLFAIFIGIGFAICLYRLFVKDNAYKRILALTIVYAALSVASVAYTPYSIYRWFGNVFDANARKGISSLEALYGDEVYGFEMMAYDVLEKDERRCINILEAGGDSYQHDNALSVYSGACTPIGWFVHEWMWHNDPEPVRERADRVRYFYTCGDSDYCRAFIKYYDIDYIFVGPAEVIRYPVNPDGFYDLGDTLVTTNWQDRRLVLIKVDRSKI